MSVRVIPRLDIKGPNLVKGIQLEGLRALGDPGVFARHYAAAGADELIYQDAVASLYGRNSLLDMIARTSREVFIPMTVGGGIRSLDDIRNVLLAGADKCAVNTAAIADPDFIDAAAGRFGSSTVVVAIEAKAMPDGSYQAFTDCGREPSGRDAVAWAAEAAGRGAGEILLTSVDRDGTGAGFDLKLIGMVAEKIRIPLIAAGGAGQAAHAAAAVRAGADAVALASALHYAHLASLAAGEGRAEGNFDFVRQGRAFSMIDACSVADVKAALGEAAHRRAPGGTPPATPGRGPRAAIVDYGMGNICSVKRACEHVGLEAVITDSPEVVAAAAAVILPGVGAFGDAMRVLRDRGLDRAITAAAARGVPLMGICLGMQLLLEESSEFGSHAGLGLVPGRVRGLFEDTPPPADGRPAKTPHVGWNAVAPARSWQGTPLAAVAAGEAQYFVHSYCAQPACPDMVLSRTTYAGRTFCSGLAAGNLFGFQFHPERSGRAGLGIYAAFARLTETACTS